MRVSSAAISTLAAIVAMDLSQAAIAKPQDITVTPSGGVVVSASETPTVQVEAIAAPETVVEPTFSQPDDVQTSNKSDAQYYQDYQTEVVVPTEASPQPVPLPAPQPLRNLPTPSNTVQRPTPTPQPPKNVPINSDLVVIATDLQVVGATEELQQTIRNVIKTRIGEETSDRQLQQDVEAILNTGLFATARVNSRTTSGGLNVVYEVKPIVVRSLQLSGAKALTLKVALERFNPQIGTSISPSAISKGVEQINQWYKENGYALARVLTVRPSRDGTVTLQVAEGTINSVKFRFLSEKGEPVDENGKPVQGRTRTDFLQREVKLKPGQVFREDLVRQDLQQLFQLGLFNNVDIALEGDASKVDLVYDLIERPAKAVNLGGGYNDDSGLFGTISYKDQNFGGVNEQVGVDVQASRRDLQFDANFTSPYRASEPDRLGYRVDAFRRRGISQTFDDDIKLANNDRPREGQFGGSVKLQRPIDDWQAELGLNYTRTSIRDRSGKISPTDELGNPLSFSGTGIDDLTTVSFAATRDRRNNPVNPTDGSVLKLSTEQSIPIGMGNISMNRLRANYAQYVPVELLGAKEQEVVAFNVQGGTTIGDLPPYQTFNLGGLNSVRGYGSGDVGSGRSYVLASAEYRFPVFDPLGAVVFADFASDLGSGDTVLGEPAVVRGKPGSGFGYGAGVRLKSPIGLIRADYGINDQGESRLEFGIGQRF